jgi:hypothetical protein
LRWVECSACTALLHEPEAKLECLGEPSLVESGRARRLAEWRRRMLVILKRESGLNAGVVGRQELRDQGFGMWQLNDRVGGLP